MEKIRRESMRWHILKALNPKRSYPVSELFIFNYLHDIAGLDGVTRRELRRELDYLELRGLATLEKSLSKKPWRAGLTSCGVDIVEYTVECRPGIARPKEKRRRRRREDREHVPMTLDARLDEINRKLDYLMDGGQDNE
ncbi:MAG: hypothetical protein LBF50_03615 [Azoarcus sp.]|nr:hypothetical protein [Azoarcus sp.]